eukprot:403354104
MTHHEVHNFWKERVHRELTDYRKTFDQNLIASPNTHLNSDLNIDHEKYTQTLSEFMKGKMSRNISSAKKKQSHSTKSKLYYMPQNKQSYIFGGKQNIRKHLNIEVPETSQRLTTASSTRTVQSLKHKFSRERLAKQYQNENERQGKLKLSKAASSLNYDAPVAVTQSQFQRKTSRQEDDLVSVRSNKTGVSTAVSNSSKRKLQILDQSGNQVKANSQFKNQLSQRRPLAVEEIDSNIKTYYPKSYNMTPQQTSTQNFKNFTNQNSQQQQQLQRSQSQFKIRIGQPVNQKEAKIIDKLIQINQNKPALSTYASYNGKTFPNHQSQTINQNDARYRNQQDLNNLTNQDLMNQYNQENLFYDQDGNLIENMNEYSEELRDQVRNIDENDNNLLSQKDFDEIRSFASKSQKSQAPSIVSSQSKRTYILTNNNHHQQSLRNFRPHTAISRQSDTVSLVSQSYKSGVTDQSQKIQQLENKLAGQAKRNDLLEKEIYDLKRISQMLQSQFRTQDPKIKQ